MVVRSVRKSLSVENLSLSTPANGSFTKPFSRSSRRKSVQILSEKQSHSEPTHVGCYFFNGPSTAVAIAKKHKAPSAEPFAVQDEVKVGEIFAYSRGDDERASKAG